ncbi:MAG: glycosyltransferase, partial [Candidatus Sumerlaeia bacterium]|nr:glycosyltransferase [Candidatus Sumerlaeia bacterium]
MRVLHVIHSLDPRSGGPPEALRQLVRHQVAAGLRPMIATTDIQAMKPWMDQERFLRLFVRRYPLPNEDFLVYKAWGRTGVLRRYGFVPLLVCRLEELMKADNTRPDIVHVHGLFSHLTEATCRVARCLGIPYILRPAGGLNAYSLQVGSLFLKKWMIRISTRKNLMGAFAVQATAESESRWISGSFPGSNIVTIPHGVSVPTPHYLEESRSRFLARFPDLAAAKVVLYMGRFTEKKRPDLVLDAFIRSKLPSQGWVLVMAGDGSMREDLRRSAKGYSKVFFTGFIAGRLKWGAMAAAKVFALPSKDENFGVGVAEAM